MSNDRDAANERFKAALAFANNADTFSRIADELATHPTPEVAVPQIDNIIRQHEARSQALLNAGADLMFQAAAEVIAQIPLDQNPGQ